MYLFFSILITKKLYQTKISLKKHNKYRRISKKAILLLYPPRGVTHNRINLNYNGVKRESVAYPEISTAIEQERQDLAELIITN